MSVPPAQPGAGPNPAPKSSLWEEEDLKAEGEEKLSFTEKPANPRSTHLSSKEFFDQLGFFGEPLPPGNGAPLNKNDDPFS